MKGKSGFELELKLGLLVINLLVFAGDVGITL